MTYPHFAPELLRVLAESHGETSAIRSHATGEVLSYREYFEAVRTGVVQLEDAGLVAGDRVLIVASRICGFPISLLSCWAAGLVPVLSDGALPASRLAFIQRDAFAKARLDVKDGQLVLFEAAESDRGHDSSEGPGHVLYTSGTTGLPAGVLVPMSALRNALNWYQEAVAPNSNDRVALLSGLGHDPVLRDILVPLICQGELAIPAEAVTSDPRSVRQFLTESRVTILHTTPSMIEFVGGTDQSSFPDTDLRIVLLGGESPTEDSVRALSTAAIPQVFNVYGSTETPQIVSATGLGRADSPNLATIGNGVAGAELFLGRELPEAFSTRHDCAPDEVVVRSRHLAAGYIGHAAQQSGFVADPFEAEGWRAYFTGDIGERTSEGDIRLVARRDRELNVNGHRLNPAEVELCASRIPGVAKSHCGGKVTNLGLQVTLTIVLDNSPEAEALRTRDVRAALRNELPAWAVPSRVEISDLPALTVNHKRA